MTEEDFRKIAELVNNALDRRFEPLEGRFAGIDRRFDQIDQRLDGIDQRLDGIDQRLDGIDQRLDGIDQRLDGVDQRFGQVDQRLDGIDQRLDGVDQRFGQVDQRFDQFRTEINDDFRHQLAIQREDFQHKLDLVVEGQQALAEKLDATRDELKADIARVDRRLSVVAVDLAEHRRDTEAHRKGWRVRED